MLILDLYSKLPDGAKRAVEQIPAVGLLTIALTAYTSGKWLTSSACQALRDADGKETVELRKQRDEFKAIAFNSVGFLTERAQESAKITETATKVAEKPTVATVKLPVKPLTDNEKKAIEKPKDAEPGTLATKLEASKSVLKKADIGNAQTVQTKEKQ